MSNVHDHSVIPSYYVLQMDDSPSVRRKLSHLPIVRFTSIVTILVAFDCLICVALWIAGGDTLYLEDSVKDFSFTQSTFDLACISVVRCIILVASFYYLEQSSLLRVSVGEHDRQRSSTRMLKLCQAMIVLVAGISAAYAIIKGSFIIKDIVRGTWSDKATGLTMHITYKILCVIAVVFPLLEMLFCALSSWCLGRMIRVNRIRLLVNFEEGDEKPVKKRADIKRIALLAKPVRTYLYPLCLVVNVN